MFFLWFSKGLTDFIENSYNIFLEFFCCSFETVDLVEHCTVLDGFFFLFSFFRKKWSIMLPVITQYTCKRRKKMCIRKNMFLQFNYMQKLFVIFLLKTKILSPISSNKTIVFIFNWRFFTLLRNFNYIFFLNIFKSKHKNRKPRHKRKVLWKKGK